MNQSASPADNGPMRIRVLLLTLALVAVACGEPGVSASESDPTAAPTSTTTAPSTTTTSTPVTLPSTTLPPETPSDEPYREEWLIETTGGEITALGEHTAEAHRWVETYGPEPERWSREVISIGSEAWNRYRGNEWELVDADDGIVSDLLNGHPFEVNDVLANFDAGEPDSYEGRDVTTYSATGPVVADFSGVDPDRITKATATVSIFAGDSFATYELYYERDDGDWARLTYRTYDFGAPITIERPEVVPVIETCRDRGNHLIDEIGAYRSRYDLLHDGAAIASIEELRTLDPWAWQTTIRFTDGTTIDTLWVDGGFQYWRAPGEDWQQDDDLLNQSLTYRAFVEDLRVRDVVEQFAPIRQAEVAGRAVDIYELDIEDMHSLNDSLTRDTDALEATLWIEPCWSPALVKLEVIATGSGYAEGEFHVVYELFDLGTTDVIDIPAEALDR